MPKVRRSSVGSTAPLTVSCRGCGAGRRDSRARASASRSRFGHLGQHLGRRPGQHAGPIDRQEIDEGLVPRLDQIGAEGPGQGEAQAAAIGIQPRDREIAGQLIGDFRDIDGDRLGEGDDQHAVGDTHPGGRGAVEADGEPAETLLHRLPVEGRAGSQGRSLQLRPQRQRREADTEEKGTRDTQTGKLTQRSLGDCATGRSAQAESQPSAARIMPG